MPQKQKQFVRDKDIRYDINEFADDKELLKLYWLQKIDAKNYFLSLLKPRYDLYYKLYYSYNGDRAREIKNWQCISEDTEILSTNGWKSIGELSKGDGVLSYDIETGAILPDTVRDAFVYDIDGDVVSIKNEGTDQLVTTNHRVIVKRCKKRNKKNEDRVEGKDNRERFWEDSYNYVEAEKLVDTGTETRIPLSGMYDGQLSIGGDVAEFIGWFITDGCLPKSGPVYITQSKPWTLEKIRSLLLSLKVPFREWSRYKKDGNYDEYRFYIPRDCELMNIVLPLVPDRKPSEELWHLTLSEKRRLLDGIFFGDGSRRPDGTCHMVSKPYTQFKEWLQTLLHLSGLRGYVKDKYVNVAHSSTVDLFRKRHIKKVHYKGKVWSVSTGRTNYIARRNGNIFITGNSNVFVPYCRSVVETLVPRIIDARPDFSVISRKAEHTERGNKQQQLCSYDWEVAKMDNTVEDLVRSTSIFGIGFLQTSWKKTVKTAKFLSTKDITSKKMKWEERSEVTFDSPFCEYVDPYSMLYDWRNKTRDEKTFWMKRLLLTQSEILKRYPIANHERLNMAFNRGGDITIWDQVRREVKTLNTRASRTGINQRNGQSVQTYTNAYGYVNDVGVEEAHNRIHEVIEWTSPQDDLYAVMVNDIPAFDEGKLPILYDHKETPFIETTFLKLPGEFEGIGIPQMIENPQIVLNTLKNQRIDMTTLSIHKMWVVNPMSNIKKEDLVTRPFGIIYSMDVNGVKPIEFSDIKPSAYKEEEALKNDMRYATGVDDASMGVNTGGSATSVRHLRESTLERVRLFVNHLGDTFSTVLRHWMSMERQFFTKKREIRILGKDGSHLYPLIEKDDLMGEYDYVATVLPSLSGAQDVAKKQSMDLFQLLIQLPFLDPEKVTSTTLRPFNISLDSLKKDEEQEPQVGAEQTMQQNGEMSPEEMMAMQAQQAQQGTPAPDASQLPPTKMNANPQALSDALSMIRGGSSYSDPASAFSGASSPVNLLQSGSMPPTVKGVAKGGQGGKNTRGHNVKLGGRVNTDLPQRSQASPDDILQRRSSNLQKGA